MMRPDGPIDYAYGTRTAWQRAKVYSYGNAI